jgi:hypothetical protein
MIGALIGAGIGTAAQLGIGAAQYFKGKKLERENKRPTYQIPQEVFQNLTQAQQMALQGLPEEQKQAYIESLQQQTAYGLDQIASRKGGLTGLAGLVNQQNQGMQNLMAQDASARMANIQGLMNQRQNVADYRGQEFQFNQLNPFYFKQAQAEALKGSGMQNVMTGVGNAAYGLGAAYDAYGKSMPQTNMQPNQQTTKNTLFSDSYNRIPSDAYGNKIIGMQQGNNNPIGTANPYSGQQSLNIAQANPNIYGLNVTPSIFR